MVRLWLWPLAVTALVALGAARVAGGEQCRYQESSGKNEAMSGSPRFVQVTPAGGAACAPLCIGFVQCGRATRTVVCPADHDHCPPAADCGRKQAELVRAGRLRARKASAPRSQSNGVGGLATADEYVDGPLLVSLDRCAPICVGFVESSYDEGTDYVWATCAPRTAKSCPGPTTCLAYDAERPKIEATFQGRKEE